MAEFIDPDRGDWWQQYENEWQRSEEEQQMGIKVSAKGSDFEQPPVGMHIARCVRIVDLGTQETTWQGKPKQARKVLVSFELLGEPRMDDGRPFLASTRYTASLSDRAMLRKDLESWRGRPFTAAELEGFDLSAILGRPCMVNLVKSEDEKYTNIAAITPLPAGLTAPKAENELVEFSLDDFNEAVFNSLSDGLKETIAKSPEYTAIKSGNPHVHTGVADMDEDIPF